MNRNFLEGLMISYAERPKLTWAAPTLDSDVLIFDYTDPANYQGTFPFTTGTVYVPFGADTSGLPQTLTFVEFADGATDPYISYATPVYVFAPSTLSVYRNVPVTRDIQILFPKDSAFQTPGMLITGSKHVVVIGGHLEATIDAVNPYPRGLFRVANNSGTVHLEGMIFDCKEKYGLDAFEFGNTDTEYPDIQVQNCHMKGIYSTVSGLHADGVQYYGHLDNLRLDRVTIVSDYQGVFLDPQADSTSQDIRRTNTRYTNPNNGQGYGWFQRTPGQTRTPDVNLEECYADERTNFSPWEDNTIMPTSIHPTEKCTITEYTVNGRTVKEASFPDTGTITGHVTKGYPLFGDWCVAYKDCGYDYVSPGYN